MFKYNFHHSDTLLQNNCIYIVLFSNRLFNSFPLVSNETIKKNRLMVFHLQFLD